MDTTTHHDMPALFAQLGLPNSPADIKRFIRLHRPLPQTLNLSEAPFWSAGQVAFLREQWLQDDGDWCVQIDQLNAALREHPDPGELEQVDCTLNPDHPACP
ncbi:MAG: DUF2789 domain-containing protein [Roseateles sp.]|uniref:DUF2789 domain-containing protein n=1 Tax=Roseateles sp. TaxID=1971397 RepID=UPI004036C42D